MDSGAPNNDVKETPCFAEDLGFNENLLPKLINTPSIIEVNRAETKDAPISL